MSRVLRSLRAARRLGPTEVARRLERRGGERLKRIRFALGCYRWPSPRALDRALLAGIRAGHLSDDLQAARFFFDAARDTEWLRESIAVSERDALVRRAVSFCDHVFDLLGSGPVGLGPDIDWFRDFRSGYRWEPRYMADITIVDATNDADVKVPWELSRHQHFVTLGQAYVLTGDEVFAREFVDELNSWMDANPPMNGVNWACTMDVALRAISWTWAWHLFARSAAFDGVTRRRMLSGILAHGRFIIRHLEYSDVRGNHYLADGAGLAVLGLAFPQLREAIRWREEGLNIVWSELLLQVLEDGVDFEMSTSYQRLVAELFLTPTLLAQLNEVEAPEGTWPRIEKMLEFISAATRPDGEIALFGDADDGRVQVLSEGTRTALNDHRYLLALGAVVFDRGDFKVAAGDWSSELDWLLGRQGRVRFEGLSGAVADGPRAFHHGGFYVMQGGGFWLLADCGPVGLSGHGGHGHNDALSFELCVGGTPVVVDSGTYTYTADVVARDELRGTRAHNALLVDGLEMADLGPGLWDIADQASASLEAWEVSDSLQVLEGVHHGYERLDEPVTVRRRFELDVSDEILTIVDSLSGIGAHAVEVRFHTNLDVESAGSSFLLSQAGSSVARFDLLGEGAVPFAENSWLSPSYGVRCRSRCFGWRWASVRMPWTSTVRASAQTRVRPAVHAGGRRV